MSVKLQTSVKICGLRNATDIDTAIAGGASHIGFIFFQKSPRNVTIEQAASLVVPARNIIASVAVTVDASDEFLDEITSKMRPEFLQLHGSETPERVSQIKTRYAIPAIKALPIRTASDFQNANQYLDVADRLLFDAKPPAGSDLPGGNGVSFDWKLFAEWQAANCVKSLDSHAAPMLSGGINLNNIVDALGSSNARAIDISSGVEKAPGVKDPELIKLLLQQVREFETQTVETDKETR